MAAADGSTIRCNEYAMEMQHGLMSFISQECPFQRLKSFESNFVGSTQ